MAELSGTLVERLDALGEALTPSQEQIARFLLDRGHHAAFLTTADIAKEVGVSESTVVRFARSLGFRGFPDLQDYLRQNLLDTLSPSERLRASSLGGDARDLAQRTLEIESANLQRALGDLNIGTVMESAQCLLDAKQRYVIGLRSSRAPALLFGHYLGKILPDVLVITQSDFLLEGLNWVGEKDVILGFSFPRYSRGTMEALRWGKKVGARTIVISDSDGSPPTQLADHYMIAPAHSSYFGNSFTAAVALSNLLVAACVLLSLQESTDSLRRLEELDSLGDRFISPTSEG